MSGDYPRDKEKELQDFLDQFDKISQGFGKTNSTDADSKREPVGEPQSMPSSPSIMQSGRLERLHDSRTRKPGDDLLQGSSDLDQPMTSERNTKKKKRNKKYRWNPKRLFLTLICAGGALGIALAIWSAVIIATTPDIDADNLYSMLSQNSVIYDANGQEIESIFESGAGLRTNLDYTDMPENLVNAFVAIEDKTFWEHKGFNIVRIFGAIWDGVTSGGDIRGTSTITQQLARNLYLEDKKSVRSLERKVKEAYYAVLLERQLSKEQIVEGYLNVIYLGSGANGVQAAAQTYFSKDAKDLTLAECAMLATIPKNPTKYSPIKRLDNVDITDPDSLDFVYRGDVYSIWYQDDYRDRQILCLKFMLEQNYITQEEYDAALAEDIRASINPSIEEGSEISSYFADYVIAQVKSDLMEEYGSDEEGAENMLYKGGLRIYTTMDLEIQKIAEAEFKKNENFPTVTGVDKDSNGSIVDSAGNVLLYQYSKLFNEDGDFNIGSGEFEQHADGSVTLLRGKHLNFYRTEVQGAVDYSVEVKPMYALEEGIFYSIPGAYLLVPAEYKSKDDDGNLTIDAAFFEKSKEGFTLTADSLTFHQGYYQLQERVIQPQSAMVIMDYQTGGIKAMVGGRSLSGKLLFNRATSPRQPGSSIKPMAVYGPALQRSANAASGAGGSDTKIWTAATVIDDAPLVVNGKLWPKNWYNGYKGLNTLRQAVQQSINVCAVKVFLNLGADTSVSYLKKLGVTTLVESGDVNDLNAAALALGGMAKGVSPLQMTAGYSAFANEGVYTEPIAYTAVKNKKGETLLEPEPKQDRVFDKTVAFIMTDILRTVVSEGIAGNAAIGTQPVAGKTGTTTDNYDAWFVGYTPYYAAALWIGNDINLELSKGSPAAARLWGTIMKKVHSGYTTKSFSKPADVVSASIDTKSGKLPSALSALDPRGTVRSEYFAPGTVPVETDDVHVSVKVCADSGYLATPYCSNAVSKVMVKRPSGSTLTYGNFVVGDIEYEVPSYYCNLHNLDTATYPIDPKKTVSTDFVWNNNEEETDPQAEGDPTDAGNGTDTNTETPEDPSTKPDWLN